MIYEGREVIIDQSTGSTGECLILLHGGGGSAEDFQSSLNLPSEVLGTHTVVYPNANAHTKTWRCGGKFGSSLKDVLYISGLIYHLINNYNIDISKITIGGMSNGGMMAYRTAAILTNLSFKGVITFSSSYVASEPFLYTGKILQIHGTADANIPLVGNEDYMPLDELVSMFDISPASGNIDLAIGGEHNLESLRQNCNNFYDKIINFI
jgi:predicted esterase